MDAQPGQASSDTGIPVFELEHVIKSYPLGEVEVAALRDVSLKAEKGCILALVGPSGSGKSTILNLIGSLDRPTSGKVRVAGRELGRLTPDELAAFRNAVVGFIFQSFNLVPVLTALENVALPCQLARNNRLSADASRASDLLRRVGLGDLLHQKVNRLSGGQMQRVAIARALVNRPAIILADEPTANLDRESADNVLATLTALSREEGTSIVIATHDPAVLAHCQRTVRIADGQILGE